MKARIATIFDAPAITALRRAWFDEHGVTYYERPQSEWVVAGKDQVAACLGYEYVPEYEQYHITDLYRVPGPRGLKALSTVVSYVEDMASEQGRRVIAHIHPGNETLQEACYRRGWEYGAVMMYLEPGGIQCRQRS